MRSAVKVLRVLRARRWSAFGASVLSLVIVAGCGSTGTVSATATAAAAAATARAATATPQPTESGPTAANPVSLTMTAVSNVLYAPIYVGVEKGIFLKHGIDLKISLVGQSADVVRALQGGQGQVSANTWAGLVPGVVQGIPFKVFGLVLSRPDLVNYDKQLAVVVRPGITATKIQDLKGLKIGGPFGGASELYFRQLLKTAGMVDADVKYQNMPSPNELAALQSGALDAGVAAEPYGSIITASLPGSRVVIQGGGAAEGRIMLVALEPWLKANPVVADRLVRGLLESEQYARQHLDEAGVAASHYLSGLEVSVLTSAVKKLDFDPRWSSKVQEAFEGASQELLTTGAVKTLPKTTDILVLDILTSYEKTYPQFFTDLK